LLQPATVRGNSSYMPYSFSSNSKTLAIELGALRKLAKARRLASASGMMRTSRRRASDGAEEPSAPRSPRKQRQRN